MKHNKTLCEALVLFWTIIGSFVELTGLIGDNAAGIISGLIMYLMAHIAYLTSLIEKKSLSSSGKSI